jgi:hypothetical protein
MINQSGQFRSFQGQFDADFRGEYNDYPPDRHPQTKTAITTTGSIASFQFTRILIMGAGSRSSSAHDSRCPQYSSHFMYMFRGHYRNIHISLNRPAI